MILKNLLGRKNDKISKARQLVKSSYFGLLHRLPETTTLENLTKEIISGMSPEMLINSIMQSNEFKQRLSNDEFSQYGQIFNRHRDEVDSASFEIIGSAKNHITKNIIYLCPPIEEPTGGIKVILRQSHLINSTPNINFSSEIFCPENPNINLGWLRHKTKIKRRPAIDLSQDFIVIPEIMALRYGKFFFKEKVEYAIYVQNGYQIFDEVELHNQLALAELANVYHQSRLILTISKDASTCIKQAFNVDASKIMRLRPSINQELFYSSGENKKNIISYMPRKLLNHANYILKQILLRKPDTWEIKPIEEADEEEVARQLRQSKIFLSFSNREGLGLPPLEAAMCGNSVIGYTGQGGQEYWSNTLFKKVESGDLLKFIKLIELEMEALNTQSFFDFDKTEKLEALDNLKHYYSEKEERKDLEAFLRFFSQ